MRNKTLFKWVAAIITVVTLTVALSVLLTGCSYNAVRDEKFYIGFCRAVEVFTGREYFTDPAIGDRWWYEETKRASRKMSFEVTPYFNKCVYSPTGEYVTNFQIQSKIHPIYMSYQDGKLSAGFQSKFTVGDAEFDNAFWKDDIIRNRDLNGSIDMKNFLDYDGLIRQIRETYGVEGTVWLQRKTAKCELVCNFSTPITTELYSAYMFHGFEGPVKVTHLLVRTGDKEDDVVLRMPIRPIFGSARDIFTSYAEIYKEAFRLTIDSNLLGIAGFDIDAAIDFVNENDDYIVGFVSIVDLPYGMDLFQKPGTLGAYEVECSRFSIIKFE